MAVVAGRGGCDAASFLALSAVLVANEIEMSRAVRRLPVPRIARSVGGDVRAFLLGFAVARFGASLPQRGFPFGKGVSRRHRRQFAGLLVCESGGCGGREWRSLAGAGRDFGEQQKERVSFFRLTSSERLAKFARSGSRVR